MPRPKATIEEMESRARDREVTACYREFEPQPALQGRVRALFSFSSRLEPASPRRRMLCEFLFGPGDRFTSPPFADGSSSLVFDLGQSLSIAGVWHQNAGARGVVIGAMSGVDASQRGELPAMVGAYLHPAQVASFAHVSAADLTDRVVAVDDLWSGTEARELAAELTMLDETERLDRLETALLDRMHDREPRTSVNVSSMTAWIAQQGGRLTVESMARAAGVSRQRLTQVFHDRVGVSPKLYCRLARFQSALKYIRRSDVEWASVAMEMGYADQSHMIAEFREFCSLTPQRLTSERWFHPFIERARARLTEWPGRLHQREALASEELPRWQTQRLASN
jgi:AraC-like DNA-binding protein